jgi:hypothetical protein
MPPSADNANKYINLHQCNFFFSPTFSPDHIGNKGTVIPCPVYISVISQRCVSIKTNEMLHFVVWQRGIVITPPL